MTGLAIEYNTNEMLTMIPMIIPNSMEINKQAINVQMKGTMSIPVNEKTVIRCESIRSLCK